MINDMIASQVIGQPIPVVGMGATFLVGSDRYAMTIVEVIDKKNGTYIIGVQDDNATVTNKGSGGTGAEEYEFSPNPNGRIQYFRAKKDSKWRGVEQSAETGRWILRDFGGLAIGYRSQYRDPSF